MQNVILFYVDVVKCCVNCISLNYLSSSSPKRSQIKSPQISFQSFFKIVINLFRFLQVFDTRNVYFFAVSQNLFRFHLVE